MELTVLGINRDVFTWACDRSPVFPTKCHDIWYSEDGTVSITVDLDKVSVEYNRGYLILSGTTFAAVFEHSDFVKAVVV